MMAMSTLHILDVVVSSSTVKYKRKEEFVKLKTAIFAKERETKRCRISAENQREFEKIERKLKLEKRKAENRLEE